MSLTFGQTCRHCEGTGKWRGALCWGCDGTGQRKPSAPSAPSEPSSTNTQNAGLLRLLRERGAEGVTALEALRLLGSLRLSARVYDLRREGHDIRAEMVTVGDGKRVARYTLA